MSSKRGKVDVIDMPPGKYHHFQVEPAIHAILVAMEAKGISISERLFILFNIDGLPLSNSSSSDFWPILYKVQGNSFNASFTWLHIFSLINFLVFLYYLLEYITERRNRRK